MLEAGQSEVENSSAAHGGIARLLVLCPGNIAQKWGEGSHSSGRSKQRPYQVLRVSAPEGPAVLGIELLLGICGTQHHNGV